MNTFFAWEGDLHHAEPSAKYKVFKKTSQVTQPSTFFTFGEIHPYSVCRPQFGVHMDGNNIYHVPGNYHGKPSNFAFADGHAEAHNWVSAKFNNPTPQPPETDQVWHNHESVFPGIPTAETQTDLLWLKTHTTELR